MKILSDDVNNPSHYMQGDIPCIDAMESAVVCKPPKEALCVSMIIKYLWRYESKGGIKDIKKAEWYLKRLLEKVEERMKKEGGK